jgi:fructose-bisphosphate aldolase class I
MDESTGTCNKRFASAGIPQTEEARRAYRDLIVTTPGLDESISGAILYDETIRQKTKDGRPFVKVLEDAGIIPGIKVDLGARDLAGHPGEKVTEGLDGLRERLTEYYEMGARFAKWRAVIALGSGLPSRGCIEANAHALARYAALCQEAGLVPIVEPEVLMDGEHTLEQCRAVTDRRAAKCIRPTLHARRDAGGDDPEAQHGAAGIDLPETKIRWTKWRRPRCDVFRHVVPAAVPGIAFLSGGQSGEMASARLNAMNLLARSPEFRLPWALTFSFAKINSKDFRVRPGEKVKLRSGRRR